jgi:hypothetical protein
MRRHGSGRWREAFDAEQRFSPLFEASFDNTQWMSTDGFLANLASRSYVARLDPGPRRALLDEVEDLLVRDDAPAEVGRLVVPTDRHLLGTADRATRIRPWFLA